MDHPYIAKFYEAFLDHKYVHLVVEFCQGGDLCRQLKQHGKFEEEKVKRIIKQCLMALKSLHMKKIAHRDLKLENIMISDQDIKIIDFGISKLLQSQS